MISDSILNRTEKSESYAQMGGGLVCGLCLGRLSWMEHGHPCHKLHLVCGADMGHTTLPCDLEAPLTRPMFGVFAAPFDGSITDYPD